MTKDCPKGMMSEIFFSKIFPFSKEKKSFIKLTCLFFCHPLTLIFSDPFLYFLKLSWMLPRFSHKRIQVISLFHQNMTTEKILKNDERRRQWTKWGWKDLSAKVWRSNPSCFFYPSTSKIPSFIFSSPI